MILVAGGRAERYTGKSKEDTFMPFKVQKDKDTDKFFKELKEEKEFKEKDKEKESKESKESKEKDKEKEKEKEKEKGQVLYLVENTRYC